MKLYEIDQEIQNIFDSMSVDEETGEVSLDEEALGALQEQRTQKLENAACYVKDLEAMAKAIREEEKVLAERRKAMENKAGRIREWISFNIGDDKIETARCKISTRKGPEFVDGDCGRIMAWATAHNRLYDLVEIKTSLNKKNLLAALKDGEEIDGAEIKRNVILQIK